MHRFETNTVTYIINDEDLQEEGHDNEVFTNEPFWDSGLKHSEHHGYIDNVNV